jgi:hypothetical protein
VLNNEGALSMIIKMQPNEDNTTNSKLGYLMVQESISDLAKRMRDEKIPEKYIQEVEERTKFINMSLTASTISSDASETTIISYEMPAR